MTTYSPAQLATLEWFGAAELSLTDEGCLFPLRIPSSQLPFLDATTRSKFLQPSGIRLRARSTTKTLAMKVSPHASQSRHFDLVVDGGLFQRVTLEPGQTDVAFSGLDGREHDLELWLNWQYASTFIQHITIDAGTQLCSPRPVDKPLFLFHGSSITHGRVCYGPTDAWSMLAGRLAGTEPINIGLGGACLMETVVARFIRDQKADYMNFCVGINIIGSGTHSPRGFRSAVCGFLQVVREKHPTTPIAMQSAFYAPDYETAPRPAGLTLVESRAILKEVTETFQKSGDQKLLYVDGLELCGEADAACLFDKVHPDPDGHKLIGQRYAANIWPKLKALK